MPHRDPDAQPGPEDLVQASRRSGVTDPRILEALGRIRREGFVPPTWRDRAYGDRPVPIAHGQVTTQPSLVAQMVAALRLRGTERVLELGTGLGFQTAIVATVAAEVFSIERFPDLAHQALRNLRDAGIENATVVVGDGTLGLPEHAPFDAVVVSAAAPWVPDPLVEQLSNGGRLVHPLGPGGQEVVTAFRKEGGSLVRETAVVPAHFVRLVGEQGLPEDDPFTN
ncbi:MAG: protein-L-isoaspartate(D-aspartate) O-methyltransferase [Actinomycetota bacterium]